MVEAWRLFKLSRLFPMEGVIGFEEAPQHTPIHRYRQLLGSVVKGSGKVGR